MADALVTTVAQQQDDHALVSVPMAGFPDGFKLQPGDQVTLIHDENGLSVRPLVKVVTGAQVQAREARAGNDRFALSDAVDDQQAGGSGNLVLFVVEQEGGGDASQQVLAVRHRR